MTQNFLNTFSTDFFIYYFFFFTNVINCTILNEHIRLKLMNINTDVNEIICKEWDNNDYHANGYNFNVNETLTSLVKEFTKNLWWIVRDLFEFYSSSSRKYFFVKYYS